MSDRPIAALFEEWVKEYYQDVYRWCRKYSGDPDAARDLTQETFAQAQRKLSQFRFEAAPRTWLLAIAVRLCLREKRRRRSAPLPVRDAGLAPAAEQSAEAAAIGRIERARLRRLVQELPPRERTAILLFHGEELAYADIAAVMGTNISQVRNFLHRARRHLRRRLAEEAERGEGGGGRERDA